MTSFGDVILNGQCSVPNGSLVPKSLYDEDLQDRSQDELSALSSSSLYQTALIVKDFPHEVSVFG